MRGFIIDTVVNITLWSLIWLIVYVINGLSMQQIVNLTISGIVINSIFGRLYGRVISLVRKMTVKHDVRLIKVTRSDYCPYCNIQLVPPIQSCPKCGYD